MQGSVRIKRGVKSDLPHYLPMGELVFCTDTHELYVGMGDDIPVKKASADIDLSEIGDISQLLTDNKTSLVGAINDLTKRLKYLEENGSLGGNNSAPILSSDFNKTVFSTDEPVVIPYYIVDAEGGKMYATYTVNGTISKADVSLGQNQLSLGTLSKGSYTIKISVADRGGLVSNELQFNIVVGALEISTNFDFNSDYTESDDINIPFDIFTVDNSPITVEATLDGSVTTFEGHSGRNFWRVGTLRKGIHKVKLVAFNGTIYSNEITFNLIITDSSSLFISTDFDKTSIKATEKLTIPYRVSLQGGSDIEIHKTINGVEQSVSLVGTGNNFWNVGNLSAGIYTLTLQAKVNHLGQYLESNIITIVLTVEQTDFIPEQTVMNGLICWLDAKTKDNNDVDKNVWSDKSGNATPVHLHNLNYMTNGWIDESLKLNGNSYVEVDLAPFRGTKQNLTIDVLFSFTNVGVTSARVISCELPQQPKTGFSVDTNYAQLLGEQVGINQAPVLENKLTRATIVIDNTHEYPNSMLYLDGIVSNIVYISPESNYTHDSKIYLGCQKLADGTVGNFGECSIKSLRVYNRALSHVEVLQNHIADLPYEEQEAFRIRNEGKDIPTLEFFGNLEGMDADNQVPLRVKYLSNGYGTGINYDLPRCLVDWQGNSSLQYPIKNYNVDLFSEEYDAEKQEYESYKCQMRDNWAVQDSYHIKANLVDSSHSFNIGIAKFLDQVYTKPLPPMEKDNNAKNYRYAVDGFPILLFINDAFHGVYTYNLKQHRDVFGLSKKNTAHIMFRAEENSKSGAGAFANWEIEGATGIKGEWEQRHPKPKDREAYQELSNLIKWVATCSDEEFKEKVNSGCWLDKDFLLDYYIICYAFGMVDSLGKNMTLTTWGAGADGNPLWYPMFYDMDTCFGFTNNGALTWGPDVRCPEDYNTGGSKLWDKVMRVYGTRPSSTVKSEIEKRYEVLRNTRLTPDNVIKTFDEAIISQIPETFYNTDAINKYLPTGVDYVYMCKGNRLSHIKRWLTERFVYMDSKLNYSYSGNNRTIQFRSEFKGTIELWIKTYSPQLVSVDWGGTSLNIQTQMCNSETETRFFFNHDGTHKDFSITGANNILSIRGFKNKNLTMLNIGGASKLVELDCSQNPKLEGIDLSNAYYLRSLNVSNCGFVLANNSVLNVGACENLKTLEASGAGLTGIITTKCKYLEYVNLSNTKITSLHLSNFPMLQTLHISGCNRLARVNVSKNPMLDSLYLQNGESLVQVDAHGCTKLRVFQFDNCPLLTDMNIDDCEQLVTLSIRKNDTTDTNLLLVDVSKNSVIETINVRGQGNLEEIRWGDNPRLRDIDIERTSVENVDLSGCEDVRFHANRDSNLRTVTNGSIQVHTDGCFRDTTNLESIDVPITFVNENAGSDAFRGSSIKNLPDANYDYLTNSKFMFYESDLSECVVDLSLPKSTNVQSLFGRTKIRGVERLEIKDTTTVGNGERPFIGVTTLQFIKNFQMKGQVDGQSFFRANPNLTHVENVHLDSVTNINSMFEDCSSLTNDSFHGDIIFGGNKPVTQMHYTFKNTQVTRIPDFVDMEHIKYMNEAFRNTPITGHLVFDAPSLVSARYAFAECQIEELTFRSENVFNGSTGDGLCNMFQDTPIRIVHEYYQPKGSTNPSYDFFHMHPLWGYSRPGNTLTPVVEEFHNVDMSEGKGLSNFFKGLPKLRVVDNVKCLKGHIHNEAFNNCPKLESITNLELGTESDNLMNMQYAFKDTPNLKTIECNPIRVGLATNIFYNSGIESIPDFLDFSESTNIQWGFYKTKIREVVNFHLPSIKIISDMGYLFYDCTNLTRVDGFSANNVTNDIVSGDLWWGTGHYGPFRGCTSLQTVNNVSFAKAETPKNLFNGLGKLETISNINLPRAYYTDGCFSGMPLLQSVTNVSIGTEIPADDDTGRSHTRSNLFSSCPKLTTLTNINLGTPTSMYYAFVNTPSITSSWDEIHGDFTKVTDWRQTFDNCGIRGDFNVTSVAPRTNGWGTFRGSKLDTIYFNIKKPTDMAYCFHNCGARKVELVIETLGDVDSKVNINDMLNIQKDTLETLKVTIRNFIKEGINLTNNHAHLNHAINLKTAHFDGYGYNVTLDGKNKLTDVVWSNTTANLYIRNCASMGAEELNNLFRSLTPPPFGHENPTVYIKGCAGVNDCDVTIATKSGWVVNKTN